MASARESIASLVGEQKKLRKQKVPGAGGRGMVLEAQARRGWGWGAGGLRPGSSGLRSSVTLLNSFLCLAYSSIKWE